MPEVLPVFSYKDILEPPAAEYEVGDQRTAMGWLKHLFLFSDCEDQPGCIQITIEDRKDFKKVVDIFKKCAKIGTKESVNEWEDTEMATRKVQAACLNTMRKELGYVVEFYQ